MSIIAILWLLSDQIINATPVPGSSAALEQRDSNSSNSSSNPAIVISAHLLSDPNYRLFLSRVIWSCVFTVLSCAWVAVHPNAPHLHDPQWKRIARRLEVVVWSLVVPELTVCWAVRQWIGARNLKERYRSHRWTMAHAHFLQMGGWVITYPDDPSSPSRPPVQVLSPPLLDAILTSNSQHSPQWPPPELTLNVITLPVLTILSHSTSDPLFTAVAVLQVLWFLTQCIARGVSGASVLRIELVTLGYVVMYLVMYVIWWDKPMDVRVFKRIILTAPKGESTEKVDEGKVSKKEKEQPNTEGLEDPDFPTSLIGNNQDAEVDHDEDAVPAQAKGELDHDHETRVVIRVSSSRSSPSSSPSRRRSVSSDSPSDSSHSMKSRQPNDNSGGEADVKANGFHEVSNPEDLLRLGTQVQDLGSIGMGPVVLKPYPNPNLSSLDHLEVPEIDVSHLKTIPSSLAVNDSQPEERIKRARSLDFTQKQRQQYVDSGGVMLQTLPLLNIGRGLQEWGQKKSGIADPPPSVPLLNDPAALQPLSTQDVKNAGTATNATHKTLLLPPLLASTLDLVHSDDHREAMSRITHSFRAGSSTNGSSHNGSSVSLDNNSNLRHPQNPQPVLKSFPAHVAVAGADDDDPSASSLLAQAEARISDMFAEAMQSFNVGISRLDPQTTHSASGSPGSGAGGSSETAFDIEEVPRFPPPPEIQVTTSSTPTDSRHPGFAFLQCEEGLRVPPPVDTEGFSHLFNYAKEHHTTPPSLLPGNQPTSFPTATPIADDDANCHRNNGNSNSRDSNAPSPADLDVSFTTAEDDTIFDSLWLAVTSGHFAEYTGLEKVFDRMGHIMVGVSNNPDVDVRMSRYDLRPANTDDNQLGRKRRRRKLIQKIPTFYAMSSESSFDDILFKMVAGGLATVFGAVHLIAWNFTFFSPASTAFPIASAPLDSYPAILLFIWRICSLVVTCVPLLTAFAMLGLSERGSEGIQLTFVLMSLEFAIFPFSVVYLPARAMLLALPIVELVGVGKGWGAEAGVQTLWGTIVWWTKFLPHVQ